MVNAVIKNQPTITYEKKKAKEQRINFNNFANMDTKSFDTKIGFITNIASCLIAMLSSFPKDSREYKEIKRRISLLRFYQGSSIDSAKGDVFVPPPKYWNKTQKFIPITDDMPTEERNEVEEKNKEIAFNNKICANKKPYFFGYIYPKIMTEYNVHRNNYKKLCKIVHKNNLYDLMKKPDKTEEERKFIYQYNKYSPLLRNKCTMNILAEYVENMEFDNKWKINKNGFDYTELMSGEFILDDTKMYNKIKSLMTEFYKKYNLIFSERNIVEDKSLEMISFEDNIFYNEMSNLIEEYENKLISVCSDSKKTCDYVIEISYKFFNSKSKIFIWETFGDIVLENVKSKSKKVSYPIIDDNGFEYLGRNYSIKEVELP